MIHFALIDAYPSEADARKALPPGEGTKKYLGVWRLPAPYLTAVHAFSDEDTAEDLQAANWTREHA